MLRVYLIVQTGVVYTYRPVVDKCYVHHSCENAVFDLIWLIEVLHFLEESLIERLRFEAACRLVEVGLVALFHGSEQRELGDCMPLTTTYAGPAA